MHVVLGSPEQRYSDVRETDCSVARVALLPDWTAAASPQLVQFKPQHVHPELTQLKILGRLQRLSLVLTSIQELGNTLNNHH